jgi:hypothetical protein
MGFLALTDLLEQFREILEQAYHCACRIPELRKRGIQKLLLRALNTTDDQLRGNTMTTKRQEGGKREVAAAKKAAYATIDLFNTLTQAWWEGGQRKDIENLVTAIQNRRVNIRAILDFDTDGVLSFKYYAITDGEPPVEVLDVVPTNTLN